MRLAVFCDYSYRVRDGRVTAEFAFSLFAMGLVQHVEELVIVGRLDPGPGEYPHELRGVRFVPLPHYPSAADLAGVARVLPGTIRRFWRMLGEVDAVWVLGPSPVPLVLALLALLRRRRLVLGVRQLGPELARHRHPGRRLVHLVADVLEGSFRLLARFVPVVVVGPEIARRYRGSPRLHVSYISLLHEADIRTAGAADRDYGAAELRVLSVGRLDPEKNPLLLADVLELLRRDDPRWRLDVCGEGSLAGALAARMDQLGVSDAVTFHGYVPVDGGLWNHYLRSHMLLHVSHTEGLPQVLLEAAAARLPVVATAVGGVPEAVGDSALLIAPDDAGAAVAGLRRLATERALRERLLDRSLAWVSAHTFESECARLAAFLVGSGPGAAADRPPADGAASAGDARLG